MTEEAVRYVVNPDVSCREAGPEGVLLFNPDTNDVLVVNATGRIIWEALEAPRTSDEVVSALLARCDGVPDAGVSDDVDEFVEALVGRGFVGVYGGLLR